MTDEYGEDGYGDSDSFGEETPLSTEDFFSDLGDSFMEQVESVELGDDGSVDMRVHDPESDSAAQPGADPASSADISDELDGGQPSADATFLESQYKEVQGWATRVSQENAELKAEMIALSARVGQPSTSNEEDGAEFDMDPELQGQLDSYLEKNLGSVLASKLGVDTEELGPLLQEAKINRELRQAYAKYEDFDDHMPQMQKISLKYPDLSFDQLYNLASTILRPTSGEEGQPESAAAPPTAPPQATTESVAPQPVQPSQADVAQRAQQVQTLQSVSNDEGFAPERTINSIREAAEQALADME